MVNCPCRCGIGGRAQHDYNSRRRETEQQKQLLRTLNCSQMQGYLFSPAHNTPDIGSPIGPGVETRADSIGLSSLSRGELLGQPSVILAIEPLDSF
jgi:hypothetical protein